MATKKEEEDDKVRKKVDRAFEFLNNEGKEKRR